MMFVEDCKWTCPRCNRTVVIYASPDDTRAAIACCQLRHAAEHRAAAQVLDRLGLPEDKPRRKGRAA